MQPTLHMSTAWSVRNGERERRGKRRRGNKALVYVSEDRTISGARYHRVTTYSVRKSRHLCEGSEL